MDQTVRAMGPQFTGRQMAKICHTILRSSVSPPFFHRSTLQSRVHQNKNLWVSPVEKCCSRTSEEAFSSNRKNIKIHNSHLGCNGWPGGQL